MRDRPGRLLGYGEAVSAAILWGSSGIFAVSLFRLGIPPASVALLRPLLGGAMLLGAFAVHRPRALLVDRRGFGILFFGGGLTVGIFQIAYQLSTDSVGVPSTVALLYLAPAVVAAAAGPLLSEWPDRTRVLLLAVTLTGVWLTVFGADEVTPAFGSSGVGWGVLAGLSYGAYTLFGRFAAPRYGSIPTVVYSTLGACAFLVLAAPAIGGAIVWPATPSAWWLLIVFAALTIAMAQFLFFDALSHIEASRASIASSVEPVAAGILATLLLGQGLTALGWMGIGLVVTGVGGVGLARSASGGGAAPVRTR